MQGSDSRTSEGRAVNHEFTDSILSRPAGRVLLVVLALTMLTACPGPASEAVPPPATGNVPALPSIPVPTGGSGAVSPPPLGPAYGDRADDLDGFAKAYRSVLPDAGLGKAAAAGRELCTYLMRHADEEGVVSLGDAVTEADIHQPGYTRETWVRGFQLATEHYCREFTLVSEDEEG